MLHDHDTLAFHKKERPGTTFRSLANVPLSSAGQAAEFNAANTTKTTPESEALEFYFLNHAMSEVEKRFEPDQPLGDVLPVVEAYQDVLNRVGSRMFHYILITTCREMRHLTNSQENQFLDSWGHDCVNFTKKVKSSSQSALFNYSGPLRLGKYLDYLLEVYNKCGWSSAYGGPKWGAVAQCLRDCVHGDTTIEMMLDTSFTLAHNNGPIFNKGFQYQMYDGHALQTILDCQRAGQIPELIKAGTTFCKRIKGSHMKLVQDAEKSLGIEWNQWVNWELVEALGALGHYGSHKAQNKVMFAGDPSYVAANKDAIEAAQKAQEIAAMKKAMDEKTKLEIMPGVFVKKEEKKR